MVAMALKAKMSEGLGLDPWFYHQHNIKVKVTEVSLDLKMMAESPPSESKGLEYPPTWTGLLLPDT